MGACEVLLSMVPVGVEVDWICAGLGGVWRLKVLGESWNLRHVHQLEWVIVGGKRDVFIFEVHL